MRSKAFANIAVLLITVVAAAQQPAGSTAVFDVVSIRPSPGSIRLSNVRERPGGGFALEKGTAMDVITYAYAVPAANVIGLPGWASGDVYDVVATTSAVNPTLDDRRAMVRAMLVDRFKLRAHYEAREQPSFDLIKARPDGRLGTSLIPYEVDCEALARAGREARAAGGVPAAEVKQPPCTARITRTGLMGEMHMGMLAGMLRGVVGRPVVDKTGLTGSYRVQVEFDSSAAVRPDASPDAGPSVFTALQDQLGLKLEPSRAPGQVLVIDGIDRPTGN